nr:uncharacterized protein LOC128687343 isoform X1 [Cherax quadricarinatus]
MKGGDESYQVILYMKDGGGVGGGCESHQVIYEGWWWVVVTAVTALTSTMRGSLCAVIVLLVVAVVEPQACQARSAHRILRSTHRGVWGVQRGQQHQLESRSVNLSDQQETMVNNPGKQDLEVAGLVKGNDTFSTMAVRVSDVNATQSLGIMVNGDNTTGILTKKERNGRVNRQVVIISKKTEMEKRGAKEGRGLNGDRETEVEKGGRQETHRMNAGMETRRMGRRKKRQLIGIREVKRKKREKMMETKRGRT